MDPARHTAWPEPHNIFDFDAALLDACAPGEKAELIAEARILAEAFEVDEAAIQLEGMTNAPGAESRGLSRARARKLAAALKRVAKEDEAV